MRKLFSKTNLIILAGLVLLIGSATSAFADLVAAANVSPLDQMDEEGPTLAVPVTGATTFSPTSELGLFIFPMPSDSPTPVASRSPIPSSIAPSKESQTASPESVEATSTPTQEVWTLEDENSYLAPATPEVTPTINPTQPPQIPDRIVIPAIRLDAPVLQTTFRLVDVAGVQYQQWRAPNGFAAGWLPTSAALGVPGNTVLDGHHNIDGSVFGGLVNLNQGDIIQMYSADRVFTYAVTNKMILPEKDQPMEVRLENARWLQASMDERLTLITCWPADSNTHRLIIVATPVQLQPTPAPSAEPTSSP